MSLDNYYTAPSQRIFDDIKENAIKIWSMYDDTYRYASDKINQIKDLENVGDNAWMMVQMFDNSNKAKLLEMVEPETIDAIIDAMS